MHFSICRSFFFSAEHSYGSGRTTLTVDGRRSRERAEKSARCEYILHTPVLVCTLPAKTSVCIRMIPHDCTRLLYSFACPDRIYLSLSSTGHIQRQCHWKQSSRITEHNRAQYCQRYIIPLKVYLVPCCLDSSHLLVVCSFAKN